MAQRVVHGGRADWERVAEAIRARRDELGLKQAELVERSGGRVSLAVVGVAEGARQPNDTMAVRSVRALSRALGWAPDGIERILEGKQPTAGTDAAEENALLREELAALRAKVADQAPHLGQ